MAKKSVLMDTALLAGVIILESGGETFRAEETVVNFCYACGCSSASSIAFPTGIFITVDIDGETVSAMRRISKRGIDLARLNGVNEMVRKFIGEKLSLDETFSALKELSEKSEKSEKNSRKKIISLIASACTAAFFALLLGGSLFDGLVSFVAGFIVQFIALSFKKTSIYSFSLSFIGGCVIALLAVFSTLIFKTGSIDRIIIGSIMPLLPGLMLTSAMRDTVMGDLVAGTARLVEALLVAVALASGVGTVLSLYISYGGILETHDIRFINYIHEFLICSVAVCAFCFLGRTPKRTVIASSLMSGGAYVVYRLVNVGTDREVFAYFIATLFIALLSEVFARIFKMPSTIFIFPGIIPLVPGVGLYNSMLCLVRDEHQNFAVTAVNTIFIAGAIAIAVAIVHITARSVFPRKSGIVPIRMLGKNKE